MKLVKGTSIELETEKEKKTFRKILEIAYLAFDSYDEDESSEAIGDMLSELDKF